jgi:hypothetical protein
VEKESSQQSAVSSRWEWPWVLRSTYNAATRYLGEEVAKHQRLRFAADDEVHRLTLLNISLAADLETEKRQNALLAADLENAKGLVVTLLASQAADAAAPDSGLTEEQQAIEKELAEKQIILKATIEAPAIVTKDRERRRRDVERLTKEIGALRAKRTFVAPVGENAEAAT